MTALNPAKLQRLLEAYDNRLEQLDEVLAALEIAGLVTVKRRTLAAARRKAQQHIDDLQAETFGPKQEARLVRHLEDQQMPGFGLETALENPTGAAIGAFKACSSIWNALNDYVFQEQGPIDE